MADHFLLKLIRRAALGDRLDWPKPSRHAQLLVRFSNDNPTIHGQWVILSTYRWVRPIHRPHNAVEAWENMQVDGWRRRHPPVR